MNLAPGRTLSQYHLVEKIGEGGMGVVWRATDSTLGRDVALKFLPDLFTRDPERMARFDREAQLLASLSHPHIAAIYGLHLADGERFLAMELVEGEDLAQRLQRGSVPVIEALPLALQIAQALEHAHERGVVHRDLKPANVKLGAEGKAKVLDFGLAKALEGNVGHSAPTAPSQSPTITGPMTGANVLLGTAAYMAPEQARGQAADKRADIWAFGVVLWETLTGRRLFEGETISDTLAAVLRAEVDWSLLPEQTPQRIQALLLRCLERNPKQRLRDIGEARIAMEEVIAGGTGEAVAMRETVAPGRWGWSAAIAGAGLLIGALVTFGLTRTMHSETPETPLRKFRLAIPAEEGTAPSSPAISPDGRTVAYLFHDHLWVQPLDELEPKQIAIEPGASRLAWSPDGKTIAYFAGTRVMKTAVSGAETQVVCDTRGALVGGKGICWKDGDDIVFSRGDSAGLLEVSALGGDPRPLLKPDTSESDFHEPSALPGGQGMLFATHMKRGGINNISLWARGKRKVLLELPGQWIHDPAYARPGYILFQRDPPTPGVWALPFSLARLQVTGEPFPVAQGGSAPSVSAEGTLAFVASGATTSTQMVWVDREGKEQGVIGQPETGGTWSVSLSPDGRRVARGVAVNDNVDLWIYDTVRGTRTRLTFDPSYEDWLSWSPSGDRVAHYAGPAGVAGTENRIVSRAADGSGSADTLATGSFPAFTPDDKHLVCTAFEKGGAVSNVMEVALDGSQTPRLLVKGNPRVFGGSVSPSGALMAYVSTESGVREVFLTRYPSCQGKWQVSVAGGQWPRWNGAGDRLYFAQAEDIMEVGVSGTTDPVLGAPRRQFTRPSLGERSGSAGPGLYPGFDVTRDGSRFVILRPAGQKGLAQGIAVVQNWSAEFRGKKAAAPQTR
ncbi:MAG TPA: protein kinase [Candidatus Eisenbacteria bacterium]|jgi:Tol biopolymer transport system component